MCNTDIRSEVKAAGLLLWQVSWALGIKSESGFSRKLRRELPEDEKTKIRAVIEQLKTEAAQREV